MREMGKEAGEEEALGHSHLHLLPTREASMRPYVVPIPTPGEITVPQIIDEEPGAQKG
jgi:hypothetical protein